MSTGERQSNIPSVFLKTESEAPRVAGVEFGSLPESIDTKEIFAGTVTALLDLRQFIEDELEYNPDLTPEIKKKIEIAGATVYNFFTTLIGIDPVSQKPTEFNVRSVKTTLDLVPEEVFQAWYYLCRTVPYAQECLCADPKKRSTSESFPEQYSLPYVMVQRALRTLSATNQSILQKNPAAERVYSLLDAKNRAAQSTIDRSKPFPIKPEDITPDRIRLASANLEELLEERRENLPAEVQSDVTLVSSFLRVSSAPNLAKERLHDDNLSDEEQRYYENLNTTMSDPNRLNMTVIPSNIIEAVARLSLVDHTIHLALLGHNVRNVSQVLDASGQCVSTLDRPYAYHPITVATHNTIERDKLGLATIHELYRLDDILSTGNHGGAVEVVSASQYAKLADAMGNATPKQLGFLGKTWKLLNTPIGELRERRRNLVRERRDNAQILIWIEQIIGTDPKTLGKVPLLQSGARSPLRTILTSLEQEPHLQTRPIMEALRNLIEWAATSTSPEYGRRVRNALGGERVPRTIILERIDGIIADIQNINKHLEFFRIFKKDKRPNDAVDDERGSIRLLMYMKEMLKHPEFIVDTVASECYSAVEYLNSHNPYFSKSNKALDGIAVKIRNAEPVEAINRLCEFPSFGSYLEKLNPEFPNDEYITRISWPIDDIQSILKNFSTFFHTPEVLQDIQASLIKYATIHGGEDFAEELKRRLESEKKIDAKILNKYAEFVKINLEWIGGFRNLADRPESIYDEDWDQLYCLAEDMSNHVGEVEVSGIVLGLLEGKAYWWAERLLGNSASIYFQHKSDTTVTTDEDRIKLAIAHIKEIQQLAADTAQEIVATVHSMEDSVEYRLFIEKPMASPSSTKSDLPELDIEFINKCLYDGNINLKEDPYSFSRPKKVVSPDIHKKLSGAIKKLSEAEEKYSGNEVTGLETGMQKCVEEEWRLSSLAKRIAMRANTTMLDNFVSRLRTDSFLPEDFDFMVEEFSFSDTPRNYRGGSSFNHSKSPSHDKNFVIALQALNPNERKRLIVLICGMHEEEERKLDSIGY